MSIFNKFQKHKIETSVHDLSHTVSGTFYPGYIYPVYCKRVLAGSTWSMGSLPFLRSQPFVSPLLTNVRVSFRYFYCRNQLLWDNFDEYLTNKIRSGSTDVTPAHVHPYIDQLTYGSLNYQSKAFYDWMYGCCDPNVKYENLDALPARMYNLVFAEYYGNESVMSSVAIRKADGMDYNTYYRLRQACYKKDYFTSALPWPQRGDDVALPARVVLDQTDVSQIYKTVGTTPVAIQPGDAKFGQPVSDTYLENAGGELANMDPNGTLGVNIDIRDFRRASAVQKFLERSAVNGNRYAEYLLSHFGVRIPDNSAYRPQYLGGGEQVMNFSPVEQTSQTATTPQGTLAGKGTLAGSVSMNHKYFFTEPGWIMCMMVIRPDAAYVGGIPRDKVTFQDRLEDYPIPLFQNIGMQEVYKFEIGYGSSNQNMESYGYQQRYAEHKCEVDRVHGDFLSNMNSWVAVRDYRGQNAVVNEANVVVPYTAFNNNSAVLNYPPFFGQIRHMIKVRQPLQYFAKYGNY